jgi:putative transcriptional regulator
MTACYNKLFKLLIDEKMINADLAEKAGFSANIITHPRRDKYVSLDSIEKLCSILGCV